MVGKYQEDLVVQNVEGKDAEGVEPLKGSRRTIDLNVALRHLREENVLGKRTKLLTLLLLLLLLLNDAVGNIGNVFFCYNQFCILR